jgi:hypothetical protein
MRSNEALLLAAAIAVCSCKLADRSKNRISGSAGDPANAPLAQSSPSSMKEPGPGLLFPPYPAGVTSEDGAALPDTVGAVEYGIETVLTPVGPRFWLSRLVRRDEKGHAYWLLLDTLPVPAYDSTRVVVYTQCSLHGRVDFEILALLLRSNTDSFRTAVSAWRADRSRERFLAVSPRGVVCANESHGER